MSKKEDYFIDETLFITTLDEMDCIIESEISALERSKSTSTTPTLPKNIWYITNKEEASVVKTDTLLNDQ